MITIHYKTKAVRTACQTLGRASLFIGDTFSESMTFCFAHGAIEHGHCPLRNRLNETFVDWNALLFLESSETQTLFTERCYLERWNFELQAFKFKL